MVLCVVVGCSSKSGKQKGLKLFRIPKVITNQGEEQEKLTTGEKRVDFYDESGRYKQETRECQRMNEFVANTSL